MGPESSIPRCVQDAGPLMANTRQSSPGQVRLRRRLGAEEANSQQQMTQRITDELTITIARIPFVITGNMMPPRDSDEDEEDEDEEEVDRISEPPVVREPDED